jgi:hypothetical protein
MRFTACGLGWSSSVFAIARKLCIAWSSPSSEWMGFAEERTMIVRRPELWWLEEKFVRKVWGMCCFV